MPNVTAERVLQLLVERVRAVMGLENDERVLRGKGSAGWRQVSFDEDLRADSLDLIEVVEGVERELRQEGVPVRVAEASLVGVRLVGELADIIISQARGGSLAALGDSLAVLERRLGVRLSNRALLEQALTHRSHAFEAGGLATNERLEFLGDAVLGLVVTGLIFDAYPEAPEGRLAKIRAAAVNTSSLAQLARSLGIGEYVRLGRGEEQSGGRDKDSILADTTEALLGAVYLDQGIEGVTDLISRLFADLLTDIVSRGETLDAKTSLQELCAAAHATVPVYQLSEEGPDHEKRFTATVSVAGRTLGEGRGRSKKEAEQAAAAEALTVLRHEFAVTSGADE